MPPDFNIPKGYLAMLSSVPAGASLSAQQKDTLFRRLQPWLVVFSAALYFFFEFIQMNMFNALDPALFKAYHLTDTTSLGQLSACYMYANMLCLFPAGIILDRCSTRKIFILTMLMSVTCTFLFSMTHTLWQGELLRFITGIAGSFCLLGCVRLASRWFSPKHMALVVGLIVTFAMIGGMVAQTPFTEMIEHFGWRQTLIIDGIIGMFLLTIIILMVRDFPPGTQEFFEKQHDSLIKIGLRSALRQTISNKQNWLAGIYASLINLPIFILGSTWGSWYLMQAQHLSEIKSSYVTSMIFIGMIIGSPLIGEISDFLSNRKMPMILGAIASLAVALTIMYTPHLSLVDLLFLFFALGVVISSQVIAYPLVAESNPSMLTGTSEGLASVLIMSGGLVIPLFPALLNLNWHHHVIHGIPVYSSNSYHLAFMIMPVAFLIALIAALFIKETRCRAFEEAEENEPNENRIEIGDVTCHEGKYA